MSDEFADKIVNQAGKQTMAGVLTMLAGAALTPVCPVAGPILFNVGLGFSAGSAGAGGGAEIGKFINKIKN